MSEALGEVEGVRYERTPDSAVISLLDPSWTEGYDPHKRWLSFRLPD